MQVDKQKALELREQGKSYAEISEELGCSIDWCKRNLKGIKGTKPPKPNNVYEVYVAYSGKGVLYVGSGKQGRHKHCKSGCSTSVELNRLFFGGIDFVVEVVCSNMTKKDSLNLEQSLIIELKPIYNRAAIVVDNTKGSSNARRHLP